VDKSAQWRAEMKRVFVFAVAEQREVDNLKAKLKSGIEL
jgi:hypothetical protein